MSMYITPSRIGEPTGIVGIPDGISYGQYERVDELNSRIFDRFYPEQMMKPNLDFRSIPTKYSHFPVIDRRSKEFVTNKINDVAEYKTGNFFVPAIGGRGPVTGFINNVNTESELRNQYFVLQRGADQGVYVPSSDSDMYKIRVAESSNQYETPYKNLSDRPDFSGVKPNAFVSANPNIGKDVFMNNTRTQLRNTM